MFALEGCGVLVRLVNVRWAQPSMDALEDTVVVALDPAKCTEIGEVLEAHTSMAPCCPGMFIFVKFGDVL